MGYVSDEGGYSLTDSGRLAVIWTLHTTSTMYFYTDLWFTEKDVKKI
jgi:hypothetical protein